MDTKILTCVAVLAGASSLTAQVPSPADSADVLLGAAEHFDTTPASFQARTRYLALNRVDA